MKSDIDKRMDLAIFDAALSYTADPENINSITIVELKRPQRNDLATEETDPIAQVYDYVTDIKGQEIKWTWIRKCSTSCVLLLCHSGCYSYSQEKCSKSRISSNSRW